MKTKLYVERYVSSTEYCEGRVFFGQKGTIQIVWISGYIEPFIELIKKMHIKHIVWRVANQIVPDKLVPYVKIKVKKDDDSSNGSNGG